MTVVRLDGEHLTPEDVDAVAHGGATVEVTAEAVAKVERSRAVVDRLLDSGVPVYGLNTGFGSLRDIHIGAAQARELQRNLIRSHCCGVGEPAPRAVVRAMMLLRANTLAKGNSGVRPAVVGLLVDMLNQGVHPRVPVQGSVGASGDLAPLSHLALALMGEGEVELADRVVPAEAGLRSLGLAPLGLEAKEGLALNNGTQFMTAVGVLALLDAEYLARVAVHTCALSLEAMQGVPRAYDRRIHQVRNQRGQSQVAALLRQLLAGSELLATPVNFGALNGACDSLEKAAFLLRARADGEEVRKTIAWIDRLLERLRAKREAFGQESRLPATGTPPDDEARRTAAARAFEDDVVEVESVYDREVKENTRSGSGEARKHVQNAMERLQQVVPESAPVQDDYCLRCAPQVIGATLDALRHARDVVTRELNAATDNPLIFPPGLPDVAGTAADAYRAALTLADCRGAVVSGGNFHGAPVALVMDQCCPAVAAVGNIAERRVFHLTTGRLSNGLPRFLTPYAGLQSGLMIAQVTAASLVSENKTLCHPASADSIPTVEDAEDHVSMGAFAARKFAGVVDNVRVVVAIEMICAAQGIEFRSPVRPSPANRELIAALRAYCPPVTEDRPFGPDIERVAGAIRERRFAVPKPDPSA
jgi:histidine ammonia-lyase